MQQNRTLFFAIISIAVVTVIGMFLTRIFLAEPLNLPTGPGNVTLRVIVAPSIKPWVDQAARDFNQANSNIQVEVITANDLTPLEVFRTNNPQTPPPAAWLAEAGFVIDMAREDGFQFDDVHSVASTSLAWGAYDDKLAQFNQSYGPLTWQNINAKATNSNDALKLVIASPQNSAEGIAALVSATAAQRGQPSLSGSDVSAADRWLSDTLGDRNAQTPARPAETFASVQGRTLGDAGILSMVSWRSAQLDQADDFTLTPIEPNVTLDYPFAIWTDRQASPEGQQAAAAFRDFLLSETQQRTLANFFFDPASATDTGVQADGTAAQRLLDWANRELR